MAWSNVTPRRPQLPGWPRPGQADVPFDTNYYFEKKMTGMYLMIENPGVAPTEGLTLLGVSTTREAGVENTIGQFGSGFKYAVGALLRENIRPTIFCSTLRHDFFTEDMVVNDGLTTTTHGQVLCSMSGRTPNGRTVKRKDKLGYVLGHGIHDWNVPMALREFVANALDRSIRETGDFKSVKVEVVDGSRVRARSGFTRVLIPYVDLTASFYLELDQRFLHFGEPHHLDVNILPKASRNISPNRQVAMIYKKGVLVREIEFADERSLFDYNFGDELRLDESRNVDDSSVKAEAAKLLRKADIPTLTRMFRSLINHEHTWESTFDSYYLSYKYDLSHQEGRGISQRWQEAFALASGGAVLCNPVSQTVDFVRKKGHLAVTFEAASWIDAALENEVKSDEHVLTSFEMAGEIVVDELGDTQEVLDLVWDWLHPDFTMGKSKPTVACFETIMDAGSLKLGYYKEGVVYINADLADGLSDMLFQTMLEEVAHHITGARDGSRDLQDFAFKVATKIGKDSLACNSAITPDSNR
jgi:hypothetical protein